ncbi:MAG: hypothetical protein ACP5M9_03880 [Candidatus Micrarchaeia archaeon]
MEKNVLLKAVVVILVVALVLESIFLITNNNSNNSSKLKNSTGVSSGAQSNTNSNISKSLGTITIKSTTTVVVNSTPVSTTQTSKNNNAQNTSQKTTSLTSTTTPLTSITTQTNTIQQTSIGIQNNLTLLDRYFGGTWNFQNSNVLISIPTNGIKRGITYNYSNTTGYQLSITKLTFNSTINASEFYDIESTNIRNIPKIITLNYTLNSDSPIFGFQIPSTNNQNISIVVSPFNNYVLEIAVYKNNNINIAQSMPKFVNVMNSLENATATLQTPSNVSTLFLNNIYGGNWKLLNTSKINQPNVESKYNVNYSFAFNFSNGSGYNLTFGYLYFKNKENATQFYNRVVSNLSGINGALDNGHSTHVISNGILGLESLYGNYILGINFYSKKVNTTTTDAIPGLISLAERFENAPILISNSSTKLSNASGAQTIKTNATESLINTTTLDNYFGGSWRFLNGFNSTSGTMPTGAIKDMEGNFTNNNENFTISTMIFKNGSDTANFYNGGLSSLSNSGFNITYGSFYGGLSYTEVFGNILNAKRESEELLGEISPFNNYSIQSSLYTNKSSINLTKYNSALTSLQKGIMSKLGSISIPKNATFLTTQELSTVFGSNWTTAPKVYKSGTSNGNTQIIIENYTGSEGYNIIQVNSVFNTDSNVSISYENINSGLRSLGQNLTLITGALNNDYAVTLINNTQVSQNSARGIGVVSPYGNEMVEVVVYPQNKQPISISSFESDLFKLINYTED